MSQLQEIFRLLGRPSEQTWPNLAQNAMFNSIQWPNYPAYDLRDLIEADQIDDLGMDLLNKMLVYEPSQRITAKQAL